MGLPPVTLRGISERPLLPLWGEIVSGMYGLNGDKLVNYHVYDMPYR
jgi:hypothetical protein